MATDTSGQQAVDFVWGNFPMQPNDDRAAAVTPANIGGSTGDYSWAATTRVAADRLNAALDNHANAEAGWSGYPAFTPGAGNYIITAVSGNGTTVTYTSQNSLAVGDSVNITGLSAGAYNLSAATVATANALSFTVTNAANAGAITGQYGKVQLTTALTAADGAGLGNIIVPNVVGLTTALALDALKDAGYETANITTSSAVTPAISNVALTSNVATITANAHGYAVGQSVVIAGLTNTVLNGTYTITAVATNTFTYAKTNDNIVSVADTGTAKVLAKAGTIKTQSTAAGAASVATTATITIAPYFAS